MITEASLFNRILKCYVDYFNAFRFMVGNLVVIYHPMGHKGDPYKDDKVQLPWQLTGTEPKTIRE
jgi:hypothetical protein